MLQLSDRPPAIGGDPFTRPLKFENPARTYAPVAPQWPAPHVEPWAPPLRDHGTRHLLLVVADGLPASRLYLSPGRAHAPVPLAV